jgi:hypothetical protein
MFCRLETTLSQLTREEEKLMGRSLWEGAGPATPHSHQLCPFSENSLSAILPCDILYYLRLLITAHDREEKLIHKAVGPTTPHSHISYAGFLWKTACPSFLPMPCPTIQDYTKQWDHTPFNSPSPAMGRTHWVHPGFRALSSPPVLHPARLPTGDSAICPVGRLSICLSIPGASLQGQWRPLTAPTHVPPLRLTPPPADHHTPLSSSRHHDKGHGGSGTCEEEKDDDLEAIQQLPVQPTTGQTRPQPAVSSTHCHTQTGGRTALRPYCGSLLKDKEWRTQKEQRRHLPPQRSESTRQTARRVRGSGHVCRQRVRTRSGGQPVLLCDLSRDLILKNEWASIQVSFSRLSLCFSSRHLRIGKDVSQKVLLW